MKVQHSFEFFEAHASKIVEIKAKTTRQDYLRKSLLSLGANFKGLDHQIDTYFNVPNGRFKLREGNIENHLIHYRRSNQVQPKLSDVLLYKSIPKSSLKCILTEALGVLTVVDKKREIYFIDNVKFHIDDVESLGSFIEIEAIADAAHPTESQLLDQCTQYKKELNILDGDLIAYSYSDLILLPSI